MKAVELGIYLLTPTHVGSGQAAGAVDLPIMRESHTGYPLLPSSAIKGVLRSFVQGGNEQEARKLFGSPPPKTPGASEATSPGALAFSDGHLLAYPVRTLSAAFAWITCPWVIERWNRHRKALGLDGVSVPSSVPASSGDMGREVVLEDLLVDSIATNNNELKKVVDQWTKLLPDDGLAKRLTDHLLCVDDDVFGDLVIRATPVNARVQLTPGKTTDKWKDENGTEFSGNLWYEESLPPECLFSVMVTTRDGKESPLDSFKGFFGGKNEQQKSIAAQIGGNETVGQGLAMWTLRQEG